MTSSLWRTLPRKTTVNKQRIKREKVFRLYQKAVFDPKPRLVK